MNNKKLITFLAIGLVLLVSGGFLVLSGNQKAEPVLEQAPPEEQISVIKPEEIGLTLTMASGNRKVILEISKTEGLSGIDYELSYTAKGDIQRGIIGHIDIKTPGKVITQEITLGTCSDVCHYDEDVSNIKLILKVSKTDGTTSQVSKSLEL